MCNVSCGMFCCNLTLFRVINTTNSTTSKTWRSPASKNRINMYGTGIGVILRHWMKPQLYSFPNIWTRSNYCSIFRLLWKSKSLYVKRWKKISNFKQQTFLGFVAILLFSVSACWRKKLKRLLKIKMQITFPHYAVLYNVHLIRQFFYITIKKCADHLWPVPTKGKHQRKSEKYWICPICMMIPVSKDVSLILWIWIRPFTFMWIRILFLIKVFQICNRIHSVDPLRLHFKLGSTPSLWESMALQGSNFEPSYASSWILILMRIRIRLLTLMRIRLFTRMETRIRVFKMMRILISTDSLSPQHNPHPRTVN